MENSNENIMHIEQIEGLMYQVNEHIEKIVPTYAKQHAALEQAREDVNEFQTGALYALRTLFEGD